MTTITGIQIINDKITVDYTNGGTPTPKPAPGPGPGPTPGPAVPTPVPTPVPAVPTPVPSPAPAPKPPGSRNEPLFGWWYYQYGLVQGNGFPGQRLDEKDVYYPVAKNNTNTYCKTGLQSITSLDTYLGYITSDICERYYKMDTITGNTNFYLGTGIYETTSTSKSEQVKCTTSISKRDDTPVYSETIECKRGDDGSYECLNFYYQLELKVEA